MRTTGLLMFFLLASLPIAGAQARGMEVIDAAYGDRARSCDARRAVEARCEGRDYCEVEANNDLCGDPARGTRKSLLITYDCGDGVRTIEVSEQQVARAYCRSGGAMAAPVPAIPRAQRGERCRNRFDCSPLGQGPDRIYVAEAVYGIGGRLCDATELLRRQCDGRSQCEVEADNDLCGDPSQGDRKLLEVDYYCNNRSYTESAPENRSVRLRCPR